jgi:hypothetical protein
LQATEQRLKELKVTIPADLHLQLLRRKILYGETITATVEAALRAYFLAMETHPVDAPEPEHA